MGPLGLWARWELGPVEVVGPIERVGLVEPIERIGLVDFIELIGLTPGF